MWSPHLALERLYGSSAEPPLAELARHFLEAAFLAGPTRAVDYARRAAERAMSALAYEDAARLLEQALAVRRRAGEGEDVELCRLLVDRGDALDRAGERQLAREACSRAAEIARRLGAPGELARAALGVAGRGYSDIGFLDTSLADLLEEALAAVGDEETALRAELLARLAEELASCFTPAVRERGEALAAEAVGVARRSGSARALVKALHARFFVLNGPDHRDALLELTAEMVAVSEKTGDPDVEFKARFRHLLTLFGADDLAALDSEVAALTHLAEALREPNHRWNLLELRTLLAFLDGRFDDSERLAREGFALGTRLRKVDASPIFAGQMLAIRRVQGRSNELEDAVGAEIERFPEIPYWRLERALIRCELGRRGEARADLEQIAGDDLRDLPRNFLWLGTLAAVARLVAALGDGRRARVFYEILLPYAGRPVAVGISWVLGSADRYLGLLAETDGDLDAAGAHLERALAANARLRARPLVVETTVDCVRVLLARARPGDRERAGELREQGLAIARGLGLEALEKKLAGLSEAVVAATGAAAPGFGASGGAPEHGVFRREADYWTIGYRGKTYRLKDLKGLGLVVRLLRHPGQEFHVLDLVSDGSGPRLPDSDAGEALDARARGEYRRRLEVLDAELVEAEGFNDIGRAGRIRHEIETLSTELSRAVGIGGRSRTARSNAERARVAVRASIAGAIGRLAALDAGLGHYLSTTIRTGIFCAYTPDPRHPIEWDL